MKFISSEESYGPALGLINCGGNNKLKTLLRIAFIEEKGCDDICIVTTSSSYYFFLDMRVDDRDSKVIKRAKERLDKFLAEIAEKHDLTFQCKIVKDNSIEKRVYS